MRKFSIFYLFFSTVFYLCFSQEAFSSVAWLEEVYNSENGKKLVRHLGEELERDSRTNYPNIATAVIEIGFSKGTPLSIEVPHFFVSGWGRASYREKLPLDIEEYLRLRPMGFRKTHNYSVRMLEDFFPGDGGKGKFQSFIEGLTGKPYEREDDQKYFHSEQAVLQYVKRNIGGIMERFKSTRTLTTRQF